MPLERLSLEEAAANGGATHKYVLPYTELTAAALTQSISMAVLAAEMSARLLRLELKSSFTRADGTLTGLTFDCSDTKTGAGGLMAAAEVSEAGTEIGEKPGLGNPTSAPTSWSAGYTAADAITTTVTATGANLGDGTLPGLSKGEAWFYFEIRDGRTS